MVEKKFEEPTLEERLASWKKPLKDSSVKFFGTPPTVFEHKFESKAPGLKPGQFLDQMAMYGRSSGKTMILQNLIKEAQQRGIKATMMIHDEMQLEGRKEDIEEMKKKLGLG